MRKRRDSSSGKFFKATYRATGRSEFHLESDSRQWFPPTDESTLNIDARPSSFIFYAFSPASSSTPRQVFCRSNSRERVPTTKRSARWTLIRWGPRYQRGPPGSSGGFNEAAIKGHRTVHFRSFCIKPDGTGITNLRRLWYSLWIRLRITVTGSLSLWALSVCI